jgi:hypothetical protein
MVINYTKKTNNCNAAAKLIVAEAEIQRWRQQNEKLLNVNSTWKSFSSPKYECSQQSERGIVEFVCLWGGLLEFQLNVKQ